MCVYVCVCVWLGINTTPSFRHADITSPMDKGTALCRYASLSFHSGLESFGSGASCFRLKLSSSLTNCVTLYKVLLLFLLSH